MVGQNNKNSDEELSFAKIKANKSKARFPEKYIVFHVKSVPSWKGIDLPNIEYNTLVGYLRGAYFWKSEKELQLYNGISEETRDGLYPDLKFLSFEYAELEKLIKDAEIPRRFNIKTIK